MWNEDLILGMLLRHPWPPILSLLVPKITPIRGAIYVYLEHLHVELLFYLNYNTYVYICFILIYHFYIQSRGTVDQNTKN